MTTIPFTDIEAEPLTHTGRPIPRVPARGRYQGKAIYWRVTDDRPATMMRLVERGYVPRILTDRDYQRIGAVVIGTAFEVDDCVPKCVVADPTHRRTYASPALRDHLEAEIAEIVAKYEKAVAAKIPRIRKEDDFDNGIISKGAWGNMWHHHAGGHSQCPGDFDPCYICPHSTRQLAEAAINYVSACRCPDSIKAERIPS